MDNSVIKGTVTLIDGKLLTMNGVKDICGFDEGYIILDTSLGRIGIEGAEMKIESLSEKGDIVVKGNISAFFKNSSPEKKKGFIRKLFG